MELDQLRYFLQVAERGNFTRAAEDLLISQPDNGEQALDIAEHLIRSGALDLVVVDSVAALVPKSEIDGEMGDAA